MIGRPVHRRARPSTRSSVAVRRRWWLGFGVLRQHPGDRRPPQRSTYVAVAATHEDAGLGGARIYTALPGRPGRVRDRPAHPRLRRRPAVHGRRAALGLRGQSSGPSPAGSSWSSVAAPVPPARRHARSGRRPGVPGRRRGGRDVRGEPDQPRGAQQPPDDARRDPQVRVPRRARHRLPRPRRRAAGRALLRHRPATAATRASVGYTGVDPRFRGRGLGRLVKEHVHHRAHELGHPAADDRQRGAQRRHPAAERGDGFTSRSTACYRMRQLL